MAITHKQEMLATFRGERLSSVPLGVRIDLWYNYNLAHDTLPEKYRGCSELEILKDLGVGFQYRFGRLLKEEYSGVEVIEKVEGSTTTTKFVTPVGTIQRKVVLNPYEGALVGYETETLFKTREDYPAIKYLIENTVPSTNPDQYAKAREEIGEDGVMMAGERYCPAQHVMRVIMGYERFFYELNDHPDKVEELIELVAILRRKQYKLIIDTTDLELIRVCGNWSDDIQTPVFKKYFIPWFQEITDFVHAHGRFSYCHLDGESKRLIPFLLDTNIDVFEAWSPYPMTQVSTAELKKALGDKATIWGGIPSTLFEPMYSDEEFDDYIINMLKEIAPGDHFVAGMGDNLPFDGTLERVSRIAELIEKYGSLPVMI
jgi:hypothetical protein